MLQARAAVAAAASVGFVFALGGDDNSFRALASVERLHVQTGTWEYLPTLRSPRAGAGAVVCNDFIYVLGGLNGLDMLCTVECLCLKGSGDEWTSVASMKECRGSPAVCAVAGHIFAIGGSSRVETIVDSVERYDPQQDMWEDIVPMLSPRASPASVVIRGKLYVFG